ncbi:MAG: hypothetical protein JRJ69_17565 [Deltaproteobacteria bacterium]|nr:hypothetical protein [Deltaproteobacteria bacterium]
MTPKERPIIFSAEMVKAVLEGRKTQTRRPIKPQPPEGYKDPFYKRDEQRWFFRGITPVVVWPIKGLKPPGRPGDRLWVKETFTLTQYNKPVYRSDGCDKEGYRWVLPGDPNHEILWKSPIFMPRWASRITLEIKNIRVERIQEISPEDIRAEGVNSHVRPEADYYERAQREAFSKPWNSIYTKMKHQESDMGRFSVDSTRYLWDQNPWVWVICFSMLEKAP